MERVLAINPEHSGAKQALLLQPSVKDFPVLAYNDKSFGETEAQWEDNIANEEDQKKPKRRIYIWAFAFLVCIPLFYFIGSHPIIEWGRFPDLSNDNSPNSIGEIVLPYAPTATPPGSEITDSILAILDYGTISAKPLANAVSICALHPYGTSGMNENMPLRKNFREGLKKKQA
ncbi:hypothetical protein MNBD_CHLOROFLEXI01-963, partial [hydrothermal vent metagenome]